LITPRLECIIKHIPPGTVADIGTDHAYIPIYLLQHKISDFVIAGDVRPGPVHVAKQNIEKYQLSGQIEVRLGSGISIIGKNEVSTVVIAGMGGQLIQELLDVDLEKAYSFSKLILQPMNAQYELRKYLIEHGFVIEKEDLAVEGFKVYNVLCVRKGRMRPFQTEIEYHLPQSLWQHPLFPALYAKKHREFSRILRGNQCSNIQNKNKIKKYEQLLEELEELKEEIKFESIPDHSVFE
jgi:tRNA (adenine22-N1)-methyltransferase